MEYQEDYVDVKRPRDGDDLYHPKQYSSDQAQSSNYQQISPETTNSVLSTAPLSKIKSSTSADRRMSVGMGQPGGYTGMAQVAQSQGPRGDEAVPVGFDEAVLRGLCDMDCSLSLLADRIKQGIVSCKQVATFFRSRADVEEKYSRSLTELYRSTGDVYARGDCKAGTFVQAYNSGLRLQDQLAQNRLRFAQRLNEMAEELFSLAREGEKTRKIHKETGSRYQLIIQDAETAVEKAKTRLDGIVEELDRVLAAKEGETYKDTRGGYNTVGGPAYGNNGSAPSASAPSGHGKSKLGKAMKTGGLLFKGKGSGSLQKQEDDSRAKMDHANETFTKAVAESKQLRKEYFSFQLPKIMRLLKECADEIDLGTQYHLTRFAFLYETMTVGDGAVLNPLGNPEEGPGLKAIFESIDNRTDFKSYMQNYAVIRGTPRGPRREGPYDDGFQMPLPPHVQRSQDSTFSASQSSAHTSPQPQALPSPHSQASGYGYQTSPQPPSTSQMQSSAPPLHPSGPSHSYNPSIGSTITTQTNNTVPTNSSITQNQGGSGETTSLTSYQQDYMAPGIPASTGHTFGVDLGEQLARDGTAVPRIVEKCAAAIEMYGLESTGVYRLSGTSSRVQALKAALDNDVNAVDVESDEWSADINVVCGALKLWFRELPEPLLTHGLYHSFIEAARYENDRLRHIRLHEQVNELPDPNYATLKFFMAHLDKIRRHESVNQMSVSNLSIVFGPTLLGAPPEEGGLNLEHMSFQCKAIETILNKYQEIFVEEDDDGGR
ncbi:hypothetical protein B9479_000103 [Cryptococcus floricola]|uniref:Rho-GAP domain-containing protein n=1 Tax=Cryptococcus floricola TaxID=2591691 RepID=A0A5D3B8F6_9TREE|nr:hypothetical protein B9479_000103 [Cryptococcus floricola]